MSTKDVMQLYFEELLQEPPEDYAAEMPGKESTYRARENYVVKPEVRKVEKSPPVEVTLAEADANRQMLEKLQKQKLQALLDQQHHLQQIADKHTDIKTEVASQQTVQFETPQIEIDDEIVEATEVQIPHLLCWHENGRPLWAQDPFDVLLFEVSGLTLAVPLIALGQIQNIGEDLTPIFGQSDWFMGLLRSSQGSIKTVNTALFVMPERYNDKFVETARFVISIDGLPWGLAVDSVNQPSRIHPDDVKWRSDRSKRPWLAGTVKSAMCALIDIPQMGKILSETEK